MFRSVVRPAAIAAADIQILLKGNPIGAAAVVALKYPPVGLGLSICCLIVYLRPESPGAKTPPTQGLIASPRASNCGGVEPADFPASHPRNPQVT